MPDRAAKIRREIAAQQLKLSDKLANTVRLFTRTGNRLVKSFKPIMSSNLFRYLAIASILTNIIDSAAKSYLEMSTNTESGLLFLLKVSLPLSRLCLALVALSMIPYTSIFNAVDILLGAIGKLADAITAKNRNSKDISSKVHDLAVGATIFAGATLMLTSATVLGEVLLLGATYYYIMDAFGFNPFRQQQTPAPSSTPKVAPALSDKSELLSRRPSLTQRNDQTRPDSPCKARLFTVNNLATQPDAQHPFHHPTPF